MPVPVIGWLASLLKLNGKPDRSNHNGDGVLCAVENATRSPHPQHLDSRTSLSTSISKLPHPQMDSESSAIRRFSNRKHKRRLERTRSASDLLREQAAATKSDSSHRDEDESLSPGRISSRHLSQSAHAPQSPGSATLDGPSVAASHDGTGSGTSQQHHSLDLAEQFVAGLLGTNILSTPPDVATVPTTVSTSMDQVIVRTPHAPSPHSKPGTYLNETAFIQQLEQRRQLSTESNMKQDSTTARAHSRHQSLLPAQPPTKRPGRHQKSKSQGEALLPITTSGVVRQELLAPPGASPSTLATMSTKRRTDCPECATLQSHLTEALEDVEYLRQMATQSEFICSQCEMTAQPLIHRSLPATPAKATLALASKQLHEATARHQKQVEQITRDRAHWQQEVQFKLNKFVNLAKDLNEESERHSQNYKALRRELEAAQGQNNEMAQELLLLRAQVENLERERDLLSRLQEQSALQESESWDRLQHETLLRDQIIEDLSSKLEKALDHLENERQQQQRSRRHIIFPSATNPKS